MNPTDIEVLAAALYRAWIVARGFDPECYPWRDLEPTWRAVWVAVAHAAWSALVKPAVRP